MWCGAGQTAIAYDTIWSFGEEKETAFEDQIALLRKWGAGGQRSKRVKDVLDMMERIVNRRIESGQKNQTALLAGIQNAQVSLENNVTGNETENTSKEPVMEEGPDMALEIPNAFKLSSSDSLNILNDLTFPQSRMDLYKEELKAKTKKRVRSKVSRVDSEYAYAEKDEEDANKDEMYTLTPSQARVKPER